MPGATRQLAIFCAGIDTGSLPEEVITRTRSLVLDLVGCIIRGNTDGPAAQALHAGAAALGLSRGSHRVFGSDRTHGMAGATFLNSSLAHSLDFDDTHAASTLHPGAPVIPAALAAAQMAGATGANAIAAIVAGYETTCRVGLIYTTWFASVWCYFAALASCIVLLQFSSRRHA